MKINQTKNWPQESKKFFLRTMNDKNNEYIHFFKNNKLNKVHSMLDIGCGNAHMLHNLNLTLKNIKKIVGVEPSSYVISKLNKQNKIKKIKFIKSFAHNLPFKDNSFELVYFWSTLHWIDRNHYLQSIGEAIRVSSKYIAIMDFSPKKNHKTKYHHRKNFFTYKMDFDELLSNSGITKKIVQKIWYLNKKGQIKFLNNSEHKNNKNNQINAKLRKYCLYLKDSNILPIKKLKN